MATTPASGVGDAAVPPAGGSTQRWDDWSYWSWQSASTSSNSSEAAPGGAAASGSGAATSGAAAAEGDAASNAAHDRWWNYHSTWYGAGSAPSWYGGWGWQDSWPNEQEKWSNKDDHDVPEWDGKPSKMTMLTYFRKIEIWEATTKMAPERRGPKLLGNLQGEAFEKMEYLDPILLKVEDGV